MLDRYRDGQPFLIKYIESITNNKKVSHAYLFDVNNVIDYMDLIKLFVKNLITLDNIDSDTEKSLIYERIDNETYPELKIINPDGLWIKKDQMLDLQEEFSKCAIEGNKRIYIINECEKLNKQASNSILKFLEEPADNIIAILVTKNINLLLDTIISRCQLIKLVPIMEKEVIDSELMGKVLKFLTFFEENRLDTIIYLKKLWHDEIIDKTMSVKAFDYMIRIYTDVLNVLVSRNIVLETFNDDIITLSKYNTIDSVMKKLNYLNDYSSVIKNNVNMNMLMDKFVIELGGE